MAIWQSAANQRATRLKRIAEKRDREKFAPKVHMRRVRGEIKTVGPFRARNRNKGAAEVRIVLSDFSPVQVSFFAPTAFDVGQEISLTLEDPKRFYVKGRILFCQEHDVHSHVLSDTPFSYRIGIQFLFESAEEEKQVRAFCDLVHREYVFSNLSSVPSSEEPASQGGAAPTVKAVEGADEAEVVAAAEDPEKIAA